VVKVVSKKWGGSLPLLFFPSLSPSPPLPLLFPSPSPPFPPPLRSRTPLLRLGGLGERSSSGVWGGALAEIEFGAF